MKELFKNFELDEKGRLGRLFSLLAGSLVMHAVFVLAVLYVPGLREALHLATSFSGMAYVDREYSKTEIAERALLIDLNRFEYPPGYFQLPAHQIRPEAKILERARPEPSPTPIQSPTPNQTAKAKPDDANAATQRLNEDMSKEEQNKALDEIAEQAKIERPNEAAINKRPLRDWLAEANELRVKGELDLSATIEMAIEADLHPDGRLQNARVVRKTGDPKLVEVARNFVAALSDSGALIFLKDPDAPNIVRKLRVTVKLDQSEFAANVQTAADSPERAKQLASGYNGLLLGGQLLKRGQDEEIVYKHTKVSSTGTQILVNFSLPRKLAGEMLVKQLPPS